MSHKLFTDRENVTAVCGAVGTGISQLQFANMNMTRNIFVVGFSIFLGLSVPQYFNEFTIRAGHGPVYTAARWVRTIAKHTAMHLTFVCWFLPLDFTF